MKSANAGQQLFPQSPGMVSYTYRKSFEQDLSRTLDEIRELGITDMEFSNRFGRSAEQIRHELDQRGMRCSSFGVGYADLQTRMAEVVADAQELGAEFVRVAWIPHDEPFGLGQAEQAIRDFNAAGELLGQHGLVFCYHNHGYEFAPHGDGTFYDVMVQRTDPDTVAFELDILWAQFPGQDPAELLRRYADRFRLMHLKDLRRGVVGDLTGHTPERNDVALGEGQLDLPNILRAARETKIGHYYIEDESPDFVEQVPRSMAYLASLTL